MPTEPGRWPKLEAALAVVNRDLLATLPDQDALVLMGVPSYEPASRAFTGEEQVYVAMSDGRWQGNAVNASDLEEGDPPEPGDPHTVLAVVAEAAQDTLMELLWQAWPVCPAHGTGMHVQAAGTSGGWPHPDDPDPVGPPVWWCGGGRDGGCHDASAVGELAVDGPTGSSGEGR
ncbi:hypothetical protein OHA55_17845 [Streptomyces sp. NBC_00102]|nr:hypothetical protein [Streptomyces sp. NBC_00102]